jgi:hypothetical protein
MGGSDAGQRLSASPGLLLRRPIASLYAAALAACCAARRMARSLQRWRLGLRAGIQCHQVVLK